MSQDPATIQLALIPLTTDTYLVELAPQGPGTSLLLAEGSFSGQASSVFHEPARLITGDSYFAPTAPQSRIPATSAELQGPDGQDGVLIGIGRQSSDANHPPESLLVRATASAVRYSVPYPVQTGGLILAESGAAFFGPTSVSNGDEIAAVYVDSGVVLWHNAYDVLDEIGMLSATDDGGLLTQHAIYDFNTGIPKTTISQLDGNGAITASVTFPGQEFTSLSNLVTLGYFFKGHLLAEDQNTSALQDIPVTAFSADPGETFPVPQGGNYAKMKR